MDAPMEWVEKLRERFPSYAKAADALRREWVRAAPRDAHLTEASLATKIGELVRGKQGWWHRHERVAHLLAEMLEIDPGDLFGGSRANVEALPFPELPALPALQPGEEPFSIFRG